MQNLALAVSAVVAFLVAIMLLVVLSFIPAIVIWLIWNWLAPTYFGFLLPVWLTLPLLHVWGLLILIGSIGKGVFSVSVNNNTK